MKKVNKAVFLDRDGTINKDKGYVYRAEDFEFIEGVIDAIISLNKNMFKVIVVTNQSGIGRGFFSEEDVKNLHVFINSELRKHNAWIDKFYFCPHRPDEGCDCRKPKIALFKRAIKDFDVDIKNSFIIGDKISDIQPAEQLSCKAFLLEEPQNLKFVVNKILGREN